MVATHHASNPASLWDPHADLRWRYAGDFSAHARAPELGVHGGTRARQRHCWSVSSAPASVPSAGAGDWTRPT